MDGRRLALGATLTGVPVLSVVLPAPWPLLVGAIGLATGVTSRGRHLNPAAASLFASGAVGFAMGIPSGAVWPIPPAVALAVYVGVTWRHAALGFRAWFRVGDRDRTGLVVAVCSIPLTTLALVAFIVSGRTDLAEATNGLHGLPVAVLVLAGVGFALVNPAVEELLFRGLLQPALVSVGLGAAVAVTLQALAFGALHLNGVPGGALGMAMAMLWGAMLGYVRHRTNGLLLVWVVHVAANATIYTTLVITASARGVL
jgi:uncharacterized protein